jgi:hypothetical protein
MHNAASKNILPQIHELFKNYLYFITGLITKKSAFYKKWAKSYQNRSKLLCNSTVLLLCAVCGNYTSASTWQGYQYSNYHHSAHNRFRLFVGLSTTLLMPCSNVIALLLPFLSCQSHRCSVVLTYTAITCHHYLISFALYCSRLL